MKSRLPVCLVFALATAARAQNECCIKSEAQPWAGYKERIAWERDPDQAIKKAREAGKPVLWFKMAGDLDKEGCGAVAHAMRMVTFADGEIAAWVNEHFVATWVNRARAFHNCEQETEQRIATHKGEIFAARDACTFVTDADERVMHYFAGFYAPDHFARELLFARDVFEAPSIERRALLHESRARELLDDEKKLRLLPTPLLGPDFREKMDGLARLFRQVHPPKKDNRVRFDGEGGWASGEDLGAVWRSRRDRQADGVRHLHRVSRWIGGKAAQRGEMPRRDQVWESYDASDAFWEE